MRSFELEESAVEELKDRLPKLKRHTYTTIDILMQHISKRYKISGKKLHDMFVRKYGHTPDHWIRKYKNKLHEFAPSGDDGGDDGFNDDTLKQLAAQWYNGDEDPRVEKTLAAAGWEIGQDEGYDDEPGVFVIQSGDINGNSYMSWPADELRELMEDTGDRNQIARAILQHTKNIDVDVEKDSHGNGLTGGNLRHVLSQKSPTFAKLSSRYYGDYHDMVQHADIKDLIQIYRDFTQDVTEGMPSGVIKHKQRYAEMTPQEFAKVHKDSSDEQLLAMAWRHGYGKGSTHYVDKKRKGQQGVTEVTAKSAIKQYTDIQNYKPNFNKPKPKKKDPEEFLRITIGNPNKLKNSKEVAEGEVVPLKRPMSKVQHGKRVFPAKQRDVKEPEGNVTPLKKKDSQVTESVNGPEDIQKIKDFVKWSYKTLNIQKPYPKITLSKNTKVAQQGHHTGVHKGNEIWVYVGNRNLIDIFRTLFHELTHHRQMQLGMIKDGDSYPGSPIEMLADMAAGKYIKIYGKNHPEMFQ